SEGNCGAALVEGRHAAAPAEDLVLPADAIEIDDPHDLFRVGVDQGQPPIDGREAELAVPPHAVVDSLDADVNAGLSGVGQADGVALFAPGRPNVRTALESEVRVGQMGLRRL